MASASKTTAGITYTLKLNEEEAKALCELLTVVNFYEGEGVHLEDIYWALLDEGVDTDGYENDHEGDDVCIYAEAQDANESDDEDEGDDE